MQRDHRQIDASWTRLEDRVAFILLFTNNEPAHPGIIDSGAYARVFAVLERIADFVFFFYYAFREGICKKYAGGMECLSLPHIVIKCKWMIVNILGNEQISS